MCTFLLRDEKDMNLSGRGRRKKLGGVGEEISTGYIMSEKKSVNNKKNKRRLGKAFPNMYKLYSLSPTLHF